MNTRKSYEVDLLSSQLDGKELSFHEDDAFFGEIGGLVDRGDIDTTVTCKCSGASYRFTICSEGTVIVPCDRCLADLELRIDTSDELVVRLGEEYSDDGDCVVVPESTGVIDLSQFIYEFIALSIPITCTHEPGKCEYTMMQELSKHQAARSSYEDDEDNDSQDAEPTDERWAALKELINKQKQ